MEFHEKLQELRKNHHLTQEELAQSLFVSRTAISKWESGKGYPSIDSLKEISKFFSVTIDDLLSSEELITAAKTENESNILHICDLLFGAVDLMSITLMILPLYPQSMEGSVTSVNLFAFGQLAFPLYCVLCFLLIALCCLGMSKVLLNQIKIEKGRNILNCVSIFAAILTIFFLIFIRAPYAAAMAFLLLIIKAVLVFQMPKVHN
ncbi:MAG: helix-turn-helix transcriptional regulator [Ruminococcus sp.]|nr:helix-turn-helix transcriptional regulator [Ruminococcus sp.]